MKKQLLLVMLCAGMFCGTEAKGQEAERLSGYVQAERFTKEKLNICRSALVPEGQ